MATEKDEVQNMLIDACKMFIREYHVDGFRFDATHSSWMDHNFLRRLAHEIKDTGFKPDCLLIAENLPNEPDLNLEGYNGYAQWCDPFHDKIKALLREGVFEDWTDDSPERLGSFFYFCRDFLPPIPTMSSTTARAMTNTASLTKWPPPGLSFPVRRPRKGNPGWDSLPPSWPWGNRDLHGTGVRGRASPEPDRSELERIGEEKPVLRMGPAPNLPAPPLSRVAYLRL